MCHSQQGLIEQIGPMSQVLLVPASEEFSDRPLTPSSYSAIPCSCFYSLVLKILLMETPQVGQGTYL